MALDALANCRLIGFRDRPSDFVGDLCQVLEISSGEHWAETIPVFETVQPLAALLREMRLLDHLIAQDLEIMSQVKRAHEATH